MSNEECLVKTFEKFPKHLEFLLETENEERKKIYLGMVVVNDFTSTTNLI